MAESLSEKNLSCKATGGKADSSSNIECAVCLQISVHPAVLPCGHIFCYLCIKGIVNQSRRCAMCRQSIPVDYLDKPRLLKPVDLENSSNKAFEDGHLWFYEGHNGWWQYDERTSGELENAYQKGERHCELLVAGYLYIADFDAMLQYRQNDPGRRRRIKRDLATISSKGVAGLKTTKSNSDSNCFSNPEFVPNILIPVLQNLHISGQNLPRGNLSTLSRVNSLSSNQQNPAASENGLSHSSRGLPLESSLSSPVISDYHHAASENDNILSAAAENFELDNTIHDSLDWTIEQIEALNSELTNDYENLFRDVNNYENLDTILENSRSISSNYNQRRLENFNHRLSRSLENDCEVTNVHSTRPTREFPESSQTSLNRVNESTLIRPSTLSNIDSDNQLLSRVRGLRIRYRRGTSKQTHNLRDHETLF